MLNARTSGALPLALLPLPVPKADAGTATVFVGEFYAGLFESTPNRQIAGGCQGGLILCSSSAIQMGAIRIAADMAASSVVVPSRIGPFMRWKTITAAIAFLLE
jgi:hypothetical protein